MENFWAGKSARSEAEAAWPEVVPEAKFRSQDLVFFCRALQTRACTSLPALSGPEPVNLSHGSWS